MATDTLVVLKNITKNFGGIHALKGVDFSIGTGEVVALVGHNGAGKSVLVQILSGVFSPTAGEISINDRSLSFSSPVDARRQGIETIYQTLALADNLDTPANFFLGRELRTYFGFLDKKRMAKEAQESIARLNSNFVNITRSVRQMSGGQRQAIAIARAIYFDARLLIMDEPTAALGPSETAQVHILIRRLRSEGVGILLVSHDVRDVMSLADRIVVLKNGEVVGTVRPAESSEDEVIDMIIRGRPQTERSVSCT